MNNRLMLPAFLCGLAGLAIACGQVPTDGGVLDQTSTLDHHRPDHSTGSGGGGSDPGLTKDRPVLVTITGGLVTGPNLTVVTEDNGRRTLIDDIGGADLQLVNTQAAAIDELTNPANPICEFRPSDGALVDKQTLIAGLVGPRVRGSVAVNKRDDLGSVGYNSSASGGPWLTLGINTQTGQIQDRAEIDFLGTDPDDPTAVRKYLFLAETGIWRTLLTENDANGGVGIDLICTNQDAFLVVVDPNVP